MCGPLAVGIISAVAGIAGQIVTFIGQDEQAKAQQENARVAYENDLKQITKRQVQETDAANQKLQMMELDEADRKAEAAVAAAGSGVAGLSVDAVMRDIGARASRNKETEKLNVRYVVDQLQYDKKGSQARNQGRINDAPRPSPFGLIAGIAGTAVDAFGSYKKYQLQ